MHSSPAITFLSIHPEKTSISREGCELDVVLQLNPAPLAPASIQRQPVAIAVVIDRSGSMAGQKLQAACKAAGNISATLERNAVVVEEYGKNILNTTAAVVSERGEAKITEIKNVISQVENLSKP